MIEQTSPGQRVLEIGSGTGEISLALARAERDVTLLDLSEESLRFSRECAQELGVSITTCIGDATLPLPFKRNSFDCIWSSGLLEHFVFEERVRMLSNWKLSTTDRLISLVPNAASLAYRLGKWLQEKKGIWPYGIEMPIHSLRDDYASSGIRVVSECSIAPEHALKFLPQECILSHELQDCLEIVGSEAWGDFNQGYLLTTVGTVAPE